MTDTAMLDGITILDLTTYLPGPYATGLLAQLGARVIKVESRSGDQTRPLPPQRDGVGAFFSELNRGKESIVLDLKNEAGRATLLELAGRCDALVEAFRPGVLARLGLPFERLRETNPKLVCASLSGFGDRGPWAARPGHDANYLGLSGAMGLSVDDEGRPVLPGLQIADLAGGLQTALAVLAGLVKAGRTGQGCLITTSMYESAISLISVYLGMTAAGESLEPGRMLLSGLVPCYQVFIAKDGRSLTVCPLEPKFWMRFCALVEQPDWLSRGYDETLIPAMREHFLTRPAAEWVELLQDECCVGPVLTLAEVLESPQARALDLVDPRGIRAPWSIDGARPELPEHLAAKAGADRASILADLLELDEAEQARRADAGAFG